MSSKELIMAAMRSNYPVSQAIGILEREFEKMPEIKELIRAVFMIYLIEKYPKVRLCPLPERRTH